MDLSKYIVAGKLKIRVTPHSGRNELIEDDGKLRLYLKSFPERGKANSELIKFFKKEYKLSVRIKAGVTSREKVLEII